MKIGVKPDLDRIKMEGRPRYRLEVKQDIGKETKPERAEVKIDRVLFGTTV